MSDQEIINIKYLEAVKGIRGEMFEFRDNSWYNYIVGLPKPLQITYLIVVLEKQVINGGFEQYFVNGYGQFAKETIPALIEIGASKEANLLNEALKCVKSEDDTDEEFRKKILNKEIDALFKRDDFNVPLDILDDQYYKVDDEDIVKLLAKYLRTHSN